MSSTWPREAAILAPGSLSLLEAPCITQGGPSFFLETQVTFLSLIWEFSKHDCFGSYDQSVKCVQNKTKAHVFPSLSMDWETHPWHGFCFGFWSRNLFPVDYRMQNMAYFTDLCSLTDSVKAVVFKSLCHPSPGPSPGDIWQRVESFLIISVWKGSYWHLVPNTLQCTGQPRNKAWSHPDVNGAKANKPRAEMILLHMRTRPWLPVWHFLR